MPLLQQKNSRNSRSLHHCAVHYCLFPQEWSQQEKLFTELQGQDVDMAGNGQCDSSGFSAKCMTDSIHVAQLKIRHFEQVQIREVSKNWPSLLKFFCLQRTNKSTQALQLENTVLWSACKQWKKLKHHIPLHCSAFFSTQGNCYTALLQRPLYIKSSNAKTDPSIHHRMWQSRQCLAV